jgi:ubiquinone/menaquinone biosynthesis C-methylase UbiE
MIDKHECNDGHHRGPGTGRRGPSSFWMQDPIRIFGALELRDGDTFADLGCGLGDYALAAASIVGESGIVYALDAEPKLIDDLQEKAKTQGLQNITTMVCDITTTLPIKDNSVDVCLMATVLHIPRVTERQTEIFAEIRRILKPNGRLAILECKKHDSSFGPPLHMRLSAEEIESTATPCGFAKLNLVDFGYNYLIQFRSLLGNETRTNDGRLREE